MLLSSFYCPLACCRCYVPRVQDKDANMHFLHLDSPSSLVPVPPFGILEPLPAYSDGSPREDVLEVNAPLEVVRSLMITYTLAEKKCFLGIEMAL